MHIELGIKAQTAARRSGQRLRLNAAIKAADHKGQPLADRTFEDAVPILGDSPHHRVSWRGGDSLGLEAAQAFMLRFRRRCAKLFAFEVEQ